MAFQSVAIGYSWLVGVVGNVIEGSCSPSHSSDGLSENRGIIAQ